MFRNVWYFLYNYDTSTQPQQKQYTSNIGKYEPWRETSALFRDGFEDFEGSGPTPISSFYRVTFGLTAAHNNTYNFTLSKWV